MTMHTRVIRILDLSISLISNIPLIFAGNYFSHAHVESLLSDFGHIEDLPQDHAADAGLVILDHPGETRISVSGNTILAMGEFSRLERETEDKRYTLLGNQGLLYRYTLALLERRLAIHSFHANALYDAAADRLTIFLGGPASGKSPALMAGLATGLSVFGTELVHFSVDDSGATFYRSACLDNVRPDGLLEDFPELAGRFTLPDIRTFSSPSSKFLLDLRSAAASQEVLRNPSLRLIIPKSEAGRDPVIKAPITHRGAMVKALFDNLSEKIGASFTMYNAFAMGGFDRGDQASDRLADAERLIRLYDLPCIESYIAPPRHFMDVLAR